MENRLLGDAAEADVGDTAGGLVAGNAVPIVTAVGAGPGVEDSDVRFVESGFQSQESDPVRGRAGPAGPTKR